MVAVGLAIEAFRSQRMGIDFPFSGTTIALHLGYLAGLAGHPWIVSVFWTLGIEFQFYILVGLTYPLLARIPTWLESMTTTVETVSGPPLRIPSRRGLLVMLLGLALLQVVLVLIHESGFAGHTWLYYSAYFFVGMFAFAVRTGRMPWFLLVAYCLTIAGFGGLQLGWSAVTVPALLVVTLPNRLPWVWSTRGGALLNGLGRISYSLYLTHPVIVGGLTRRAADRGFMTTDAGAVLVYLSEIALALTVATVFYYLFERPAVHLSHRIKLRRGLIA
jgi:peptidoglycan/LPS O-acetylase OafA/YrhL